MFNVCLLSLLLPYRVSLFVSSCASCWWLCVSHCVMAPYDSIYLVYNKCFYISSIKDWLLFFVRILSTKAKRKTYLQLYIYLSTIFIPRL